MKYEISEIAGRHVLHRYGEVHGIPNNAELQFWQERNEARDENAKLWKYVNSYLTELRNEGVCYDEQREIEALLANTSIEQSANDKKQ